MQREEAEARALEEVERQRQERERVMQQSQQERMERKKVSCCAALLVQFLRAFCVFVFNVPPSRGRQCSLVSSVSLAVYSEDRRNHEADQESRPK